jgi:vitamin-K-epoxide reductase (warfarin-sensitive)
MRYVLILLAAIGIYLSAKALQIHYSHDIPPCSINDVWDCGTVNRGKYAVFAGVPVALIGIVGYLLLAAFSAVRAYKIVAPAALAGLGFSLYLAYLEKYVIEAWCIYCVGSLAVISLMTVLSWTAFLRGRRRVASPVKS